MHLARHNPAVRFAKKGMVLALVVCTLIVILSPSVQAQGCAMCQTVMPRGNEPMARGMFWSVLLLMAAPFVVGASIGGWLFYQHRSADRARRPATPVLPLPLAYAQKEDQQ
jgi:hypothetical protein